MPECRPKAVDRIGSRSRRRCTARSPIPMASCGSRPPPSDRYSGVVSDYQVLEMGGLDEWREHYGGFRPESSRDGRRVVDHDLTMQFIGMTANAFEPGEEAGYWHTHARVEELYVFLAGRGQMGLDDDVVDVGPGTVVRVGPGRVAHVAMRAGQPRAAALALHPCGRLRTAALPRRQPARQRPSLAVVMAHATRSVGRAALLASSLRRVRPRLGGDHARVVAFAVVCRLVPSTRPSRALSLGPGGAIVAPRRGAGVIPFFGDRSAWVPRRAARRHARPRRRATLSTAACGTIGCGILHVRSENRADWSGEPGATASSVASATDSLIGVKGATCRRSATFFRSRWRSRSARCRSWRRSSSCCRRIDPVPRCRS